MHPAMLTRRTAARFVCRSCTRRFELRLQRRRWQSTSAAPSPALGDLYDVVCVGGGPAGLSLLAALRADPVTAGLRLALVEAQDLGRTRAYAPTADRFANRCSSLTPASALFLDRIGAWPHLCRDRVQAYEAMRVWDGVTDAAIDFAWPAGGGGGGSSSSAAREKTGSTIAYMVENDNLTAGLLRRLDELGGVDVFDATRVDHIGFGPAAAAGDGDGDGDGSGDGDGGLDLSSWPEVHLTGGSDKTLLARLLVGADGANSPVRSFAGIEARGWDYDRHGVVATLLLEDAGLGPADADAAQKTAYQRFLPTGPVAVLPLPGRFATLVWSTTPAHAALLRSLGAEDFVAMVNAALRLRPVDLAYLHTLGGGGGGGGGGVGGQRDEVAWRLENTPVPHAPVPAVVGVQAGSVASFPLRLRHADTYIGERVALVGDAAHTVHPLAGQGLNQGQGDVASLARTLAYAVQHGQDLGVRTALEPYPAERYAANHVLMGVCDKLHKLYAVESGPLVPLRSLGLRAVDALGPLKSLLMSQAAGTGLRL